MKGVQEKLDDFSVVGAKLRFMHHEEKGRRSSSTLVLKKPLCR